MADFDDMPGLEDSASHPLPPEPKLELDESAFRPTRPTSHPPSVPAPAPSPRVSRAPERPVSRPPTSAVAPAESASLAPTLAKVTLALVVLFAVLVGGRIGYRRVVESMSGPTEQTYELGGGMISLTGPAGMIDCPEQPDEAKNVTLDCKYSPGEFVGVVIAAFPIPPGGRVSLPAITGAMRMGLGHGVTVDGERWTDLGGQLIREISGSLDESDARYDYRAYVLVNRGRLITIIVEGKQPVTEARSAAMEGMLRSVAIRR